MYLVSVQIDMDVLRALPSDIRIGIERALCLNGSYDSSARQPKIEHDDGRGSADSERPSCSFWSEVHRFEPTLPSLSQVRIAAIVTLLD